MTKDKNVVVEFTKEKETKNTFRFSENGDDPVIGTLYVQKRVMTELGNPETLRVTLEV